MTLAEGLAAFTHRRVELALADRVDHVPDSASSSPQGFPGRVRVPLCDGQVVAAALALDTLDDVGGLPRLCRA
jgi:hypothetical protein